MVSGPLFRREYLASTRGRRPFVFRTLFVVGLAVVFLIYGWLLVFRSHPMYGPKVLLIHFGRVLILVTIVVELLGLLFFVPASVGGAIAEEREKDTLSSLLLTRLGPIEIVLTKMVARWVPVVSLILAGLPFLVAGGWLAGLEVESALAFLVLLSTSGFMASLAILASAQRDQAGTARGQATGWIFGWLIGPSLVSIMPIASGSLWGDLLVEIKRLCSLIAPSSPLSLLTDNGWYYRTSATSLEIRVGLMVGLQALFGLLVVCLAPGRLQTREKHPNWLDPTRGHRPRCGNDPIFWREFELPIRRGAGPLVILRLRYLGITILVILKNLLALLGVLLALLVPTGLLISTIYYSLGAFRELSEHGYGPGGPFTAREQFNILIRMATVLMAFFPAVLAGSVVTGKVVVERNKKSWDVFLTTPLSAREILGSKARVSIRLVWLSAWPLPILWAIGLALGVVTPQGLALTAIDLALVIWASVALGLYLSFRPMTTNASSYFSLLALLVFFGFHAPLLLATLGSPRDLALFVDWSLRLRWGLVLAGLSVLTLTGLAAWLLTRCTINRFDEWVGRPWRS